MLSLEESKELTSQYLPGFNFPELSLQNLYYGEDHKLHPTRKALVGTLANGESYLYAEPSGRYQLVPHEQVIGNTIDFIRSPEIVDRYGEPVFEPRMWANGGQMKFDVSFPASKMMIEAPRGKVEVSPKISFVNSYDLTRKISLLFEALQLACLNGMIAHRAIEQARKRHMVGFDMPKMLSLIPTALENYPKQMETWTKLARINMKGEQFLEWANGLNYGKDQLLFGQRHFNEILDLEIMGSLSHNGNTLKKQYIADNVNMWEAHNAFTQFLTHNIESEDVRLAKSIASEEHFMKLLN